MANQKSLTQIDLPRDPTAPMEAATKAYVDANAGGVVPNEVAIVATIAPTDPEVELWYDPSASAIGALGEVVIDTVEPTDPAVELWFDPSAPATDEARWNSPWGAVAESTPSGAIVSLYEMTITTVLSIPSVAFVTNRRYLALVQLDTMQVMDADAQIDTWLSFTGGTNWESNFFPSYLLKPGVLISPVYVWQFSEGLAEDTGKLDLVMRLKATVSPPASYGSAYASAGCRLVVYDVGPVAGSSPPPSTTGGVLHAKVSGAWTPIGTKGTRGVDGVDGVDGVGVPPGGAVHEVLTKWGATDHDTGWSIAPPIFATKAELDLWTAPDGAVAAAAGLTYVRRGGVWNGLGLISTQIDAVPRVTGSGLHIISGSGLQTTNGNGVFFFGYGVTFASRPFVYATSWDYALPLNLHPFEVYPNSCQFDVRYEDGPQLLNATFPYQYLVIGSLP